MLLVARVHPSRILASVFAAYFAGGCETACPMGYELVDGSCTPLKAATITNDSVETSSSDSGVSAAPAPSDAGMRRAPAPQEDRAPSGGRGGSTGQAGGSVAKSDASSEPEKTELCATNAGKAVCEGAVLHRCDEAGKTTHKDTCMSDALCQVGLAAGSCGICAPGAFRCQDVQLQQCDDAGQWTGKKTCESAALCQEAAGDCTDLLCMPNTTTCDAAGMLLTCNADGSDFLSTELCAEGLCDADHGRCNQCKPNSKSCDVDAVVTCSEDGQTETREPCMARGECWSARCSGTACTETPKLVSPNSLCEGNKHCDGLGGCVECLEDSHCADGFECNRLTRRCEAQPSCGNSMIDPGENCEISGPQSHAAGTCNRSQCRLTDSVYAICTGMPTCPTNGNLSWTCSPIGLCTHPCTESSQCETVNGKGACVRVNEAGFCAIRCEQGCPGGTMPITAAGIDGCVCGTFDPDN